MLGDLESIADHQDGIFLPAILVSVKRTCANCDHLHEYNLTTIDGAGTGFDERILRPWPN